MKPGRRQRGGAVKLLLVVLVLLAAAGAWAWFQAPEYLPEALRRQLPPSDPRDDPTSPQYAPKVYRWRDADGVLHITDVAPEGREYEEVRIRADTNLVPSTLPPGQEGAGQRED